MLELGDVKVKTAEALRAAEADPGASVVLVAVVREFDSKATKGNAQTDGQGAARDCGHRAGAGRRQRQGRSRGRPRLGEQALQAVLDAHLALCILKTTV